MSKYAAQVENGVVVNVIVGSVEWATENLGGVWYGSDEKIPSFGIWDEVHGFRPAKPYPSWVWDGSAWVAPVPLSHPDAVWDEDTQSWVV